MTDRERYRVKKQRYGIPDHIAAVTLERIAALYELLKTEGPMFPVPAMRRIGAPESHATLMVAATYLIPIYEDDKGRVGVDTTLKF